MSEAIEIEDPCGEIGPTQQWAVVWFFAAILGGIFLTFRLATIDDWMFNNDAQVLDFKDYRENRVASTTIGSEAVDPRAWGDLNTAEKNLKESRSK